MTSLELTWQKVVTGGFVLLGTCVAATYQLVTLSKQSEIAALKEQVATAALQVSTANLRSEIQDKRVTELERRLDVASKQTFGGAKKGAEAAQASSTGAPTLQIASPAKNAQVGDFADVRIQVNGAIPKDSNAILFVRDPTGQWWPWGASQGDTWYGIQIGVDADKGKQFEIRTVLTDQKFESGKPIRVAPQGIASASVQVTRR